MSTLAPLPPWLQGVVPSDQMHDMLIGMCTEADRLEEAVDLVKRLARQPRPGSAGIAGAATGGAAAALGAGGAAAGVPGGVAGGAAGAVSGLQEHTLNSLIRALCGKYIDRALRMLSLCQVSAPTRQRHGVRAGAVGPTFRHPGLLPSRYSPCLAKSNATPPCTLLLVHPTAVLVCAAP